MKEFSPFRDLTRGGQITLHSLHMLFQVLRYGMLITVLVFLSAFCWFYSKKTTSYDRSMLMHSMGAELKIMMDAQSMVQIPNPNGSVVALPAKAFLHSPKLQLHLQRCQQGFWGALEQSLMVSLCALALLLGYFKIKGKLQAKNEPITGQVRVEPKTLRKMLKNKEAASDFTVAEVPLVRDTEVQHILLSGTTGTGKSVCMQELMDQVRAKGQRAIVYDIDGAFIPLYYRPDKDVILNPLDERSPVWNIWQECEDAADFDTAAHSMMPLHLAGTDPFWIHSAHTIFSCAALKLQEHGLTQTHYLLDPMFCEELGSLSALLLGTPAESLVSQKNEKTALSIKATLSTHCKSLLYLRDDSKGPFFSIRRWIEADEGDGWLFIASNAQKMDALKPLISVWLDIAAKSILSLTPSQNRHLWFFMDELPSLHRLPSFMNVLSRGRKYGACFVSAIQDIHQLHAIYGHNDAESLTALFNTKIFYRTQEPDSAAWMARVMGNLELIEKKEGFSYGAHEMRDGVSIHQERRREPVVRESEFLGLEDLEAFLRLPGTWPISHLRFKLKKRKPSQKAFIPRLKNAAYSVESAPDNTQAVVKTLNTPAGQEEVAVSVQAIPSDAEPVSNAEPSKPPSKIQQLKTKQKTSEPSKEGGA
ncbi:MAG: type IV conjugative transfer system coupling protein TraD [Gammaproteobacteria bacterium]|nr:type IV conjugative transfer system coupling protein TraD [Gammaproteobacteria bacterium]